MAALEDFCDESIQKREQRLVEEEEIAEGKKRQLKRPAEERGATERRGPRRRELTN